MSEQMPPTEQPGTTGARNEYDHITHYDGDRDDMTGSVADAAVRPVPTESDIAKRELERTMSLNAAARQNSKDAGLPPPTEDLR